jgi:L-2,4-diaminobutyrate transaminase
MSRPEPDLSRSDLSEIDRKTHLHPFTRIGEHQERGPTVIAEGKGLRLRGSDGREYLDALSGLWCVAVGYGREEIVQAISDQSRRLSFYHSFGGMTTDVAVECAEKLIALAPPRLGKVFFGTSGSDANDSQIKIVRYYNHLRGKPEKCKVISREGAYHGSTVLAASLSGLPQMHRGFGLPIDGILHTSRPHTYRDAREGESEAEFSARLAADLDALIEREGADTIAAFIAEPVMGAGGVIVPPEGYFPAIQSVLKAHDVLMIADEVICGFGRLGTCWGSQRLGIEPDLMTVAKALTSGYVPMSACLVSDEIWDVLRAGSDEMGPFAHGYTYTAHPLAAAAAVANLDVLERESLVERTERVGVEFQRRLRKTFGEHPLVGDVRGIGLIAGIELMAEPASRTPFDPAVAAGPALHALLLEEGLLTRALGDTLALCPALVISDDEVDELFAKLERGLSRLSERL